MDPAIRQIPAPRSVQRALPKGETPRLGRLGSAWLGMLALLACGEPGLKSTPPEQYFILPGMPEVKPGEEYLDEDEGGEGALRQSRPRICERFAGPQAPGALDLLILPDFGRSMAGRRDELLASLDEFLDEGFLIGRSSFRIGVLSAAPPAAGEALGRLEPIAGSAEPFVTCALREPGEPCSNGDWTLARRTILEAIERVVSASIERAERGSASLGLLALDQALLSEGEPAARFLRPEAELHVVVISDSDDLSCSSRMGGMVGCRSFEACGCLAGSEAGGVEEFARALRGVKGYGQEDRVGLSAWVATRGEPLFTSEGLGYYSGCAAEEAEAPCKTPWEDGAACALHAPRYAALAQALGGEVADICDEADGLSAIAAHIGGSAPAFNLRRKALSSTLETVLLSFPDKSCNHQDSCLEEGFDCIRGSCGEVVFEGGADGWQYVSCSSGSPRNMVRFERQDRLRDRKIEICYDVDVGADPLPCP